MCDSPIKTTLLSRHWLAVNFKDKDHVKKLGAKYDAEVRCWYVPDESNKLVELSGYHTYGKIRLKSKWTDLFEPLRETKSMRHNLVDSPSYGGTWSLFFKDHERAKETYDLIKDQGDGIRGAVHVKACLNKDDDCVVIVYVDYKIENESKKVIQCGEDILRLTKYQVYDRLLQKP